MDSFLESAKLATDTMKQLMTLSSAILALSATFLKDLSRRTVTHKKLIGIAWSLFIVSIVFAFWSVLAITGTVWKPEISPNGIYGSNVVIPSMLAIFTFVAAIVFFACFAYSCIADLGEKGGAGGSPDAKP